MKQIAFSTARALGSVLPTALQHVIIKGFLGNRRLIDKYGFNYLSLLSDEFNIVALSARGQYGTMSSAPHDVTIFKRYAETGLWSSSINNRLKRFFEGGKGTYLDIGANIGMTVVPLARDYPAVWCYAFEPEPINYQNLSRNIRENCADGNVTSFQIALCEKETVLPFSIATNNLGDHRLHVQTDLPSKQGETGRKVIEVDGKRLDDLAIEMKSPALVKIDTQGAEPYVIAGGQKTLAQADVLLIEWSPYHMARLKSDPYVVLEFLKREFSFGTVENTDGKSVLVTRRSQMKDVVARASETINVWRDDPYSYVDIIAEKV